MDLLTISETTWRGMDAWRIRAPRLDLVVTRIGGHLASLSDAGSSRTPLWQPQWAASDPATVREGGAYGSGPEARLLATIVGHNWCCDRFGAPWPGESRPLHGEVAIVPFTLQRDIPSRATWTAWLPETRLHVRQTIEVDGEAVRLVHAVAHDDAEAREIEWAEHVNVAGDFLDGVRFAAGVDRVLNWPKDTDEVTRFAAYAPEADLPIAEALAFPPVGAEPHGDVLGGRVVNGWWSAENPRWNRRLTYLWDEDDFPWLALWTQDRSRTGKPWDGRERVRGMEFSTKPWPEGKPPASRARTYLGRPTTCRVPPGRWKAHPMTILWERLR